MKIININVTKAKIEEYRVLLNEEMPEVQATIGLYTENNKRLSSFTITSGYVYSGYNGFDLPISMIPAIKEIANELEVILVRSCNSTLNVLGGPK